MAGRVQSPGVVHVANAFRELSVRPAKEPVPRGRNVTFTFWCMDLPTADRARVSLVHLVRERHAALAQELDNRSAVAPAATPTDLDVARHRLAHVDPMGAFQGRRIQREPPREDVSGDVHHLTVTVPRGSEAHSFLEAVFSALKIGVR